MIGRVIPILVFSFSILYSGPTLATEDDNQIRGNFSVITSKAKNFGDLDGHDSDPLIEPAGFAERNGDAHANLVLSQILSLQENNLPAQMGIEIASIRRVVHDKFRPLSAEATFETVFLDRKIILRLHDTGQFMLSHGDRSPR